MDQIKKHQEFLKSQIEGCYITKGDESDLTSEVMEEIMKGKGNADPIGFIKKMGDRFYIKTSDGWKYHSKDGKAKSGTQAASHAAASAAPKLETSHTPHMAPVVNMEDESDKIAKEKMGDINFRFKAFAAAAKGVITGKFKSAIAYGTGGVGKTYTVIGQLAAAGKRPFDDSEHVPGSDDYDYVKITGKMTAPQVYKTLYQHNGKILLFDDCDSVLRDGNAINLFKGALDTSGDGTIQYATTTGVKDDEGEKLPNRFKFNGRAIFISNLAPQDLPQPLKSRAVGIDLTMNKQQTIDRIKEIAKHPKTGKYQNLKFPGIDDYTHEHMNDVINYLDKHKDHIDSGHMNVRTIGKILGLKQIAEEMGEHHQWEKFADQTIFSKGDNSVAFHQTTHFLNLAKSYGYSSIDILKSELVKSEENVDDVEKGGVGSGRKEGGEHVDHEGLQRHHMEQFMHHKAKAEEAHAAGDYLKANEHANQRAYHSKQEMFHYKEAKKQGSFQKGGMGSGQYVHSKFKEQGDHHYNQAVRHADMRNTVQQRKHIAEATKHYNNHAEVLDHDDLKAAQNKGNALHNKIMAQHLAHREAQHASEEKDKISSSTYKH